VFVVTLIRGASVGVGELSSVLVGVDVARAVGGEMVPVATSAGKVGAGWPGESGVRAQALSRAVASRAPIGQK
jgi:hypothetical protein